MNLITKSLSALALLALAACNNPSGDAFGAGGGADAWGSGISSTALGDPRDPTSVAYFNERIGDRVFFTVDSSNLTVDAQSVLRAQAAWINQNPAARILIEGHADERGTREYNVALGARRAAAVERFLVGQGVSPSRISTVSYGKERPVEVCAEQRCWDVNRRGVTVITR
jgi:peptidoglycan-associated lipoprotein